MNTLHEEWEHYSKAVYHESNAHDVMAQLEQSFYAGAISMVTLVKRIDIIKNQNEQREQLAILIKEAFDYMENRVRSEILKAKTRN